MSRKINYLIVALAVATVWGLLSYAVTMVYAEASEPPHADIAPDPWLLRGIHAIMLFPVDRLLPLSWMTSHFGERNAVEIYIFGMFAWNPVGNSNTLRL